MTEDPDERKKNNTSVQLTDDPYQYPNGSWGIWKTNLSIVGHSTEELQLQVELTGHAVKEQPQAAGQVLSRQKTKAITKKKKIVYNNKWVTVWGENIYIC